MSKKHFLRGLRDGIPIGLGYFAVSFGIGISAHNAHLSIFQGFLLSFLNNASSGEYGGITIIAADSGLWAMALMMLVVNARYLLMSCALSQRLSPDTPLPWRLLIAYDLTDEIFGLAIAQPGYLEVWYYFGTMCAAMPGWSIGTVLGVLMGNLMPVWAVSGCSVMLFGMFLAIIIPVGKQNRIVLGCIGVSFLIRTLPLTLIRRPITNRFLRSFLFYVPYVTLAVMTFPAIMNATQSPIAGAAAMVIGIVAAWCGLGLLPVSLVCCATVLILEHFIV